MRKITLACIAIFCFAFSWKTNAQFTESFETEIPATWTVINNGGANGWVRENNPSGGAQDGTAVASLTYNATAHDDYLITPAIAVTAGVNDRLSYYIKSRSSSFLEPYEVLLSTTDVMASSFTVVLQASSNAPSTWTPLSFDLSAYVGSSVYVAIHATGTDEWQLFVDNVVSDALPSCPDPTALTATNMTSASADLGWSQAGGSANWDIEWGIDGFTPTGTPNVNDTTDNPYTLSGLSADTDYQFYVRADCGADDVSDTSTWVGPFSFTTLVSCPAPTALTATNMTTVSADLGWSQAGGVTNWDIEWGVDGFTPTGTPTINDTSDNPYTLLGLSSGTAYQFYVRADCGADDVSDTSTWAGPFSFGTLCDATNVPYTEDFQASTSIPLCGSVTNEGTGNSWTISTATSYGFTPNQLRYTWNSSSAANTWFFTQGINLTVGQSYTISYDYGGTGTSFPENLKVAYGMNPSAAAMVNELADQPGITTDVPLNNSIDFVPGTTGIYYFGFQCYSAADQFYLHLDNINIDESLGINESVQNVFTYFPNPVNNVLSLRAQQQIQNVAIYNMLGQEVLRVVPNTVDADVDMAALQTGAYFVKVTVNDRTKTVRVIKN